MNMKINYLIILGLFYIQDTMGQSDFGLAPILRIDDNTLMEKFKSPPGEARMSCYWWWINSMATKESITRDLEEMKAKGYGSATLIDAGSSSYEIATKTAHGPVFMSPDWMGLYKHAVREADRLGISLCVNVQSGWNPGGPSITPEHALKKLTYSECNISGGKILHIKLALPESNLLYRDVCVQAVKQLPEGTPIKDEAIPYWSAKSFNSGLGFQEIFPLDKLREGFLFDSNAEVIKKSEILDLTDSFDGETLNWDAPEGNWTIIRYGWTCTGVRTSTTSDGWEGLSVDHLSAEAFDVFSKTVIEPLIYTAKEAGNSVRFLQTDSWEMGVVNWTNRFPEEFKKYRGYDIFPYLPVMTGRIVESPELSNRFLQDLRRTVSDCIYENHYMLFKELAHKHGMMIDPESGGPCYTPVDALQIMSISDIPHGEYWARSISHVASEGARLSVRQSACVAHTNGKRFVEAEGPTSIGPQWERSPKDLKGILDRIFCSGVNRLVWHAFVSSPKEYGVPGNEYFAGTHLNPNVTWWEQAGDFVDYIDRCSYLLQQGLFVADVLYYTGDDVPNMVFLKEEVDNLNFGYDWDKCSKDVILNRLSFSEGKIRLPDGMSYQVLILPPHKTIDLEVLRKIEQLVLQGMTVIGEPPLRTSGLTNYPEGDKELYEIRNRMWGWLDGVNRTEQTYGKGRVIWGQDINNVLMSMSVKPDLSYTSRRSGTLLDYIHRRTEEQDIYFVTNRYAVNGINDYFYRYMPSLPDRYEFVNCKFRVTGKVPELWNPQTGDIRPVLNYYEENGTTVIPLHFNPEGSIFVVFRNAEKTNNHIVKVERCSSAIFPDDLEAGQYPPIEFETKKDNIVANIYDPGNYKIYWNNGSVLSIGSSEKIEKYVIMGNWVVRFDSCWGKSEPVIFNKLYSWTDSEDPEIRYFSGKAIYENTFYIKTEQLRDKKMKLDLGNVQDLAVIKVNDHVFPVSWSAPFEVDITPYVKEGQNTLSIEIVNLWPNRLIGDSKLPKQERRTKTNIVKFDAPDSEKYLRTSGLLGPVKIRSFKQVKIEDL